jgi:diguanylate cyclase (GGDEF)-like protein
MAQDEMSQSGLMRRLRDSLIPTWTKPAPGNVRQAQVHKPETLPEALACLRQVEQELSATRAQVAAREAEFHAMAQQDALTGLPNHEAFAQAVRSALSQSSRRDDAIAVLLIDLDGFKAVNDTWGHAAGDRVLVAVAIRLRDAIRDTDLLGRMAGDQFAVLLQDLTDEAAAIHAAERILAALRPPLRFPDVEVQCGASIGIATSQGYPTINGQMLNQRADIAVHKAKAAGGGRFHFFDTALHEEAEETNRIKGALTPVLNTEQFTLAFQPRIDLQTGQPCGAEALIRWQHPELGLVSPARFIPIAEACGQILPLCDWIAEEVFRSAALWRTFSRTAGIPLLPIAMNLSAVQLRYNTLRGQLAELARTYAIPSAAIELEVTETAAIDDAERMADQLAGLRADGYRIAIDDFGTGYASLALAVQLPADYLKIDRSFVSNMLTSRRHAAAVATTLALGRSMDLTVIAEGIETEQEAAYLQARGCDEAQGFWFAKPMPFQALMQWLKDNAAWTVQDREGAAPEMLALSRQG